MHQQPQCQLTDNMSLKQCGIKEYSPLIYFLKKKVDVTIVFVLYTALTPEFFIFECPFCFGQYCRVHFVGINVVNAVCQFVRHTSICIDKTVILIEA